MNNLTRQELKEFVQEILQFAYAVSSVAGTKAVADIVEKGARLMEQLDKDPTII
jgi:hypothetical protein